MSSEPTLNNQLFGCVSWSGETPQDAIRIPGSQLLADSKCAKSDRWDSQLFVTPNTKVLFGSAPEHDARASLWGTAVHPNVPISEIAVWAAQVVAEGRYERLKELLGYFVIIVEEPAKRRLSIVSDILGVRPFFYRLEKNRLIFGSDVWLLQRAGLTSGEIDYDAVSTWITYGYNCTQRSLFADLRRLPPGSAVVLQGEQSNEIPYAAFRPHSHEPSGEDVAKDLHEIVSSTVRTLLANFPRVTLALSGGFDSRYLLASSSVTQAESIECVTVSDSPEEELTARQVADVLGVPLKVFPVEGSIWDLYDSAFHFMADGFPISKFVTDYVARKYPGIPMMNGFMGDSLMRGSHDRIQGKYETEWRDDLANILQRQYQMVSFDILRKDLGARLWDRSRLPMERAVREGGSIGKIFGWADFYYRQRHYISNNFLQHLGQAEALLPFYSWALLSYKMQHDYTVFDREVYQQIFTRYFGTLAAIPHASDLVRPHSRSAKVAKCIRTWALQLLPKIFNRNCLSLLARKRSGLMALAGLAGDRRAESAILNFERFYLLEKRCRDASLNLDWQSI